MFARYVVWLLVFAALVAGFFATLSILGMVLLLLIGLTAAVFSAKLVLLLQQIALILLIFCLLWCFSWAGKIMLPSLR